MAYQRNMAEGASMRLYYSPDQPQLRQTIMLKANVMENTGEPLSKGDVVARIVAPSGKAQTIRFKSTGEEWGAFAGEFTSKEAGTHQVTLSCRQTDENLEATFFVQGSAAEPVGRAARPEVLEEIARVSEGKVLSAADPEEIVQYLSKLPDPPPAVRRLQLWNHPITALTMVTLLGCVLGGTQSSGTDIVSW